jgi:outer membrane protein
VTRTCIGLCTLLLIILFINPPLALSQAPRIGYVNSAKILQEYPEAVEANRKLDAMSRDWQTELERLSRELQDKYETFQKKEPLMKEEEKRSQREDLLALEQRGIQFRQQKFGNDGELAMATDSLMRPIKNKVMRVIEQVAKDEKLQFVFDRTEQIVVLLYGEAKYDYTNLVIDRLKRGGTATGK